MSANYVRKTLISSTGIVASENSEVIELDGCDVGTLQVVHGTAAAAKTFDSEAAEVSEIEFESQANTDSGDWLKIYAQDGTDYGVFADKSTANVVTGTFPSVAGSTGGDYIVVKDTAGLSWAAALNKSGADPEPTGAVWTAIAAGRKVNVDISGGTDAASVAALVETAMDALTGFTATIVTDDSAADGTMTFTSVAQGLVGAPEVHNADDSGAGSIAVVVSNAGTNQTPTASNWTSIAGARTARADLRSATTAAQVAAVFETAFDGITGFTAKVTTDDTAADGTMLFEQTVIGATTDPVTGIKAANTVNGMTVTIVTSGTGSDINVPDSEITILNHGYVEGTEGQLTTTGTLPDPFLVATDYYIIPVDANTVQLAASYEDALAGTAIAIVDEGDGIHTFTPSTKGGSVQPQVTNVAEPTSSDWINKGSAVSISGAAATAAVEYDRKDLAYSKFRVAYTHTGGQFSLQVIANLKT